MTQPLHPCPTPGVRQLRYELELSRRVFIDYAQQHDDKAEEAVSAKERESRKLKAKRNRERAASCQRALDAFDAEQANTRLPDEGMRERVAKCSCMEVAGEDPRCIRHGEGTVWFKENPDLCGMEPKHYRLAVALSKMPPHTLYAVGSMEDGPFARLILPNGDGGYTGGYVEAEADTVADAVLAALSKEVVG